MVKGISKKLKLWFKSRINLMAIIIASLMLVILSSLMTWISLTGVFRKWNYFWLIYLCLSLIIVVMMFIVTADSSRMIALANNYPTLALGIVACSCLTVSVIYTYITIRNPDIIRLGIICNKDLMIKFISIIVTIIVSWLTFVKKVQALNVKIETENPNYKDDMLIIKANTKFKVQALVDGNNSDVVEFVGVCLNDKLIDIVERKSNNYILSVLPDNDPIIQPEEIEPHKLSHAYDLTGKSIIEALNINDKTDKGKIICFLYKNSDGNFFYKNAYLELDDEGKINMSLKLKTTANITKNSKPLNLGIVFEKKDTDILDTNQNKNVYSIKLYNFDAKQLALKAVKKDKDSKIIPLPNEITNTSEIINTSEKVNDSETIWNSFEEEVKNRDYDNSWLIVPSYFDDTDNHLELKLDLTDCDKEAYLVLMDLSTGNYLYLHCQKKNKDWQCETREFKNFKKYKKLLDIK